MVWTTGQRQRFLGIVLRQANRLDAIITDLLLLSRIERGNDDQRIETDAEPLAQVLQVASETCEKKAQDKSIQIAVDCPCDLVAKINAPLLEQAVINLIDNAIKYSDAGATVHVAAMQEQSSAVIRVMDNGRGIAANHLPRLFERFYRVDKARSRELGGTGLGLAIVKHIMTAHQGFVQVESTVGRGSTFTLRFPLSLPNATETPAGESARGRRTVDDLNLCGNRPQLDEVGGIPLRRYWSAALPRGWAASTDRLAVLSEAAHECLRIVVDAAGP